MSDVIFGISQIMQEVVEAQRTNVQRTRENNEANALAQQNQELQFQENRTNRLLQQDFFDAVRSDLNFEEILNDEQFQNDVQRQQEATSLYQDQVDQRLEDRRDLDNALDVRG